MAKAVKTKAPAGKLAGQKVALVGKFWYQQAELEQIVKDEGGTLVDGEQTAPDIVVQGTRGKPPATLAKIQKKHPGAAVLPVEGFFKLVAPAADEFAALLLREYQGSEEWNRVESRIRFSGTSLDLSGTDLRKFQPANANLHNVTLDDCDFRGATLIRASFGTVRGARFDGARFTEGSFLKAERWQPEERRDESDAVEFLCVRGLRFLGRAARNRDRQLRPRDRLHVQEGRPQRRGTRTVALRRVRLHRGRFVARQAAKDRLHRREPRQRDVR